MCHRLPKYASSGISLRTRLREREIFPRWRPKQAPSPASSTQAYRHELLPTNRTIPIHVEFFDHRHQLLLFQAFSQFSSHPPQILQTDFALRTLIKELKRSQDLLPWISRQNLRTQYVLELRERQQELRRGRG